MKGLKYSNPVPPEQYKCKNCGASGVKLWRDTGDTDLLCVKCAAVIKGIPETDVDENGMRETDIPGLKTDQIGWCVPAVPLEDQNDDLCWSYGSVPSAGVDWWKALPTRRS